MPITTIITQLADTRDHPIVEPQMQQWTAPVLSLERITHFQEKFVGDIAFTFAAFNATICYSVQQTKDTAEQPYKRILSRPQHCHKRVHFQTRARLFEFDEELSVDSAVQSTYRKLVTYREPWDSIYFAETDEQIQYGEDFWLVAIEYQHQTREEAMEHFEKRQIVVDFWFNEGVDFHIE